MNAPINSWVVWPLVIKDLIASLAQIPSWLKLSHEITANHRIGDDFIGVNIATSSDPACDEYIIQRLQELEITHVRLAFTYCSQNSDAQRLLETLLSKGFDVLLTIFPSREEAAIIHKDQSAQLRWQGFVTQVLTKYGTRISALEIGNTPNRGKWSGYESKGYVVAVEIAVSLAKEHSVTVAGPNISDFEPLYNMGFLKFMQRLRLVPRIHTDNLFVERVIQPELYDHRVLGYWAKTRLKLNLIKKARIIAHISQRFGCIKTYCSYNCWTRKRLARWNTDTEQKHADYLFRYLTLAAASGVLDRVYWGPLICHRDGLIDCGNSHYPEIDQVTFYRTVRGDVDQFRVTKAFEALKNVAGILKNVFCIQGVSTDNGVSHFIFETEQKDEIHLVWCLDRAAVALSSIYPDDCLAEAEFLDTRGHVLDLAPKTITEQPLIIHWKPHLKPNRPTISFLHSFNQTAAKKITHRVMPDAYSIAVDTQQWRGAVLVPNSQSQETVIDQYLPEALMQKEEVALLRDKRNRIWNVKADNDSDELISVKLNRARGIKKFSYRFLDSKGRRHWNNATEMLRRGVNTPQPIAFFERHKNSGVKDNYYLARYIPDTFSCRHLFGAFKAGDTEYRGLEKTRYFEELTGFVANMHNVNIIHRDLSSGNLIMTITDNQLAIYVIDIGRAIVSGQNKSIRSRHRLSDLKRICYKLNWEDRRLFIGAYNRKSNHALPSTWRLSLYSYDLKHRLKKLLKGKI